MILLSLQLTNLMHFSFTNEIWCKMNWITILHLETQIPHSERSELPLQKWTKVYEKCQKLSQFGECKKTSSSRSNSVTRQVNYTRTKIGGKAKTERSQMRLFLWFSNTMNVYFLDALLCKVLSFTFQNYLGQESCAFWQVLIVQMAFSEILLVLKLVTGSFTRS